MSDNNYQPIFDYMDERFSKVENQLGEIQQGLGGLQTSVDGLTKIVRDFQDERILLVGILEA